VRLDVDSARGPGLPAIAIRHGVPHISPLLRDVGRFAAAVRPVPRSRKNGETWGTPQIFLLIMCKSARRSARLPGACRPFGEFGAVHFEARDAADPPIFLCGHDHSHSTVRSKNQHRLVLDSIEQSTEVLSDVGDSHDYHVSSHRQNGLSLKVLRFVRFVRLRPTRTGGWPRNHVPPGENASGGLCTA